MQRCKHAVQTDAMIENAPRFFNTDGLTSMHDSLFLVVAGFSLPVAVAG